MNKKSILFKEIKPSAKFSRILVVFFGLLFFVFLVGNLNYLFRYSVASGVVENSGLGYCNGSGLMRGMVRCYQLRFYVDDERFIGSANQFGGLFPHNLHTNVKVFYDPKSLTDFPLAPQKVKLLDFAYWLNVAFCVFVVVFSITYHRKKDWE